MVNFILGYQSPSVPRFPVEPPPFQSRSCFVANFRVSPTFLPPTRYHQLLQQLHTCQADPWLDYWSSPQDPPPGRCRRVPLALANKSPLSSGLSALSRSTPCPFVCAIVAGCRLGHCNTVLVFPIFLYVQIVHLFIIQIDFPPRAGHVLLTGTTAPSAFQHPNASLGSLVVVTIFIMDISVGAIKANVSPSVT